MSCYSKVVTTASHVACNELDMHADTCCAGANWALMELTGDICNVTPFLDSYQPLMEIPLVCCGTVWTDPDSSQEYLLIADQMLWFGTSLPYSLINPNQICAYGILVYDDPYYSPCGFGIDSEQAFIPFDTMGTIIHFESRVPSDWKKMHLPVILLTDVT